MKYTTYQTDDENSPEFLEARKRRLAREARFAAEHPNQPTFRSNSGGGRRCSKCRALLSNFIDWDSRNEHSIECYDRALPVPARYL